MSDSIATAYVQIEPTFKGVNDKIKKELGADDVGEASGKSVGSKFSSGFASVIGTAGKVVAGAVAAGGAAVTKMVSDSAAQFAEYEQLAGGVKLLFGRSVEETEALRQSMLESGMSAKQVTDELANMSDAADIVMKNAESAFSRVQMSTNDYLQTANSFATGLKESLGGDSEAAANLADRIIVAQADVVAATGNNAENVANAFAGIMKNNFTMLDNLQLGIKPTKEGMQEVIDKMNELNGTEYEMGNLADMQSAIVDYIDYVGMAGYAQNEASGTIQGSLATLSAAWDNLLTGMGNKDADLSSLIDNLVQSASTFIDNMRPIIEQALMGVSTMISELAPVLATELPALVQTLLPSLLTAAGQIVAALGTALQTTMPILLTTGADVLNQLIQGFLQALPDLLPMVIQLVSMIGSLIIENLPMLLEAAVQIIVSLATGITQALPNLIPAMVEVMANLVIYLLDNIDLLIDAALQLMIGLATGLVNALPVLVEKAPIIIGKLFAAFLNAIPKLLEAGAKIIKVIIDGIVKTVPQLLAKIPGLISDLKAKFLAFVPEFLRVGSEIVEGIKTGITNAWSAFSNWMSNLLSDFVDSIVSFFQIGSPSKLMADEVGRWIPAGIAEGIEEGMGVLDKAVDDMTTDMLSTTLNPSVVQNYTPQANTASNDLSGLMSLLQTYLPQIAAGENVNISLEGDAGRLFRMMQMESIRNTQIVGTGAVLSAI